MDEKQLRNLVEIRASELYDKDPDAFQRVAYLGNFYLRADFERIILVVLMFCIALSLSISAVCFSLAMLMVMSFYGAARESAITEIKQTLKLDQETR